MSHSEFTELCKKMYSSMLSRIKLVEKMGEEMSTMLAENRYAQLVTRLTFRTLVPLALAPASDGPQLPPRTPEGIKFEPGDILTSACELANTRASIIVSSRSEQHSSLSLSEFVEIFNQSMEFVTASEALAKRVLGQLRGVIHAQARSFLQAYHQQRLTRSARLVEEETWVQVDVPSATQHAANLLVEAAVSDPGECFVPPRDANGANGQSSASTKLISIEGKTFCVVKATSESLQLLSEYLAIVINLELVATDVMTRIIEFLRSFNSRICQLVLGAGAMRSAGLKNITAKHLALASQSLSVIIALIPYVREFIRRHVNPRQAVMLVEFDKLKRDYQDHQEEIHAKLVAIMSDRLAVHCGELREIDWEQPSPRDAPHSYALMLVKETATLHKVLSKYLANATVESVMSQVIAAYVSRLGDEYTKVELKSEDAKKR
jgi:vacuolar protein sorting-associated protein 54